MKPISVVIITYNRPDDALDLARNISRLEGLEEWVEEVTLSIIDPTVSYQPLEDFIAAHPAIPFRYTVAPENLGVSRGRNYAVSLSRAPYLVFLDDDALFRDADALRQMIPIFESRDVADANRPVGIVAFKGLLFFHRGDAEECLSS